jgi:CheY-like chemotaxis protein
MATVPVIAKSLARPSVAHKRILVVDDSEIARKVVRSMLKADHDADWDVVEAASGEEFLGVMGTQSVASEDTFDAVILDVRMPGVGGLQACQVLREVDQRVPILFLTADGSREGFRQGQQAGGDSYLTKPFSASALKAALHVLTSVKRR